MVPVFSIVCMGLSLAVALALPVFLFLSLWRGKGANPLAFPIGCAAFLLFALVLEGAVNNLIVVHSPLGAAIRATPWLYALYGGLMAGLFEETGRFLAFRTVLRGVQDRDVNALMYGAGHGGIEAALLLGIPSINNIIYSVAINTGRQGALTESLSGDILAQVENVLATLIASPSWTFLLGAVERVLAIALHISLSVLVWFAVKNAAKRYLYPLAILLHCAVDFAAALCSFYLGSLLVIELLLAVMTVGTVLLARRVWQKNRASADAPAAPAAE